MKNFVVTDDKDKDDQMDLLELSYVWGGIIVVSLQALRADDLNAAERVFSLVHLIEDTSILSTHSTFMLKYIFTSNAVSQGFLA